VAFDEFFTGRPAVVAFFYTRCDNPRKCSLTVTKLAALQRSIEEQGQDGAVRIAAITYDPAFDLPHRLRLYGADRGVRFGEHVRFFRVPSGFDEVRRRLDLGVNYGAATVNRHRTELFVLNAQGRVAAAFARVQWDVDAVLDVLAGLAGPDGLARSQPDPG
jgi:protein SCO1